MGIVMVLAMMKAVVTHCMSSTPPRSPTMVGRAVAVMVSAKEDVNIARASEMKIVMTYLRL